MAQTPLPSGHSPIEIPENTTLAKMIAIINANFRAIPRIFKGDEEKIFVTQSPNTVNITFGEGDMDGGPGAAGGGGGGPPGFPPTGSFEITYVNSTGCIQDPADPDCAIPFDVQFRDEISFVGGVLTRTLLNAFVNMHNECKFLRCTSSSISSSGATYLDRWRPCDAASSAHSSSDDNDVFLNPIFFEIAVATGFASPVIQLEGDGVCYQFEARVTGEVEDHPPGEVLFYDSCNAPECLAAQDAPCICDTTATVLENTYSIGVNLTGCVSCRNNGLPAWDKSFTREVVGGNLTCRWFADPLSIGYSYGGKDLSPSNTYISLNTTLCRWEIRIFCLNLAGSNVCIWFGTKGTGNTPVGTYTRVTPEPDTGQSPCDGTATLTVS